MYSGRGISDWGGKIKGWLSDAYDWAKRVRPAHKLKSYVPGVSNIPYVGKAIDFADYAGFGRRRRKY